MDSTEYIEVISSQTERPTEIDVTSSSKYVYLRENIQKYEEKDEQQNIIFKGWKYQERKVLKTQWLAEATAQNKKNIDLIMGSIPDIYEGIIALGGV